MADIKIKAKDFEVEASPQLTDYAFNERIGGSGKQPKITLWQKIFDLFIASGLGSELWQPGISAAGTNQATATILTKDVNRIDTVAPGTGVIDNVAATVSMKPRTVQNNGANDLLYYPFLGGSIYIVGTGSLGTNVPFSIAPGNQVTRGCYTNGQITFR